MMKQDEFTRSEYDAQGLHVLSREILHHGKDPTSLLNALMVVPHGRDDFFVNENIGVDVSIAALQMKLRRVDDLSGAININAVLDCLDWSGLPIPLIIKKFKEVEERHIERYVLEYGPNFFNIHMENVNVPESLSHDMVVYHERKRMMYHKGDGYSYTLHGHVSNEDINHIFDKEDSPGAVLASNKHLSDFHYLKLLDLNDQWVKKVASNPGIGEIVFERLMKMNQDTMMEALMNPQCPQSIIDKHYYGNYITHKRVSLDKAQLLPNSLELLANPNITDEMRIDLIEKLPAGSRAYKEVSLNTTSKEVFDAMLKKSDGHGAMVDFLIPIRDEAELLSQYRFSAQWAVENSSFPHVVDECMKAFPDLTCTRNPFLN